MQDRDFQVCIYFDSPEGQQIQTSYSTYLSYYKLLGWHLLNKAPEMPGLPDRDKPAIMQTELII